jgi:hypothetical protein
MKLYIYSFILPDTLDINTIVFKDKESLEDFDTLIENCYEDVSTSTTEIDTDKYELS